MLLEKEKRAQMLGTEIRLLLGAGPDPEEALDQAISYLQEFSRCLSRFDPDSELSALNNNRHREVAISPLLHRALTVARESAAASGGLLDPTVLSALRQAGYQKSWTGESLPLSELVAAYPGPHRAQPSRQWEKITLSTGKVSRPPGLQIDLGGIGKGLAADQLASRFTEYSSWCLDLGGDLRFAGQGPRTVSIPNPFPERLAAQAHFTEQAVATSAVWKRSGRRADGQVWHHLLDPLSGQPAWSEFIQVSAFAPTLVEAERLSKEVLLTGRADLLENGGLLLDWQGEWTYA